MILEYRVKSFRDYVEKSKGERAFILKTNRRLSWHPEYIEKDKILLSTYGGALNDSQKKDIEAILIERYGQGQENIAVSPLGEKSRPDILSKSKACNFVQVGDLLIKYATGINGIKEIGKNVYFTQHLDKFGIVGYTPAVDYTAECVEIPEIDLPSPFYSVMHHAKGGTVLDEFKDDSKTIEERTNSATKFIEFLDEYFSQTTITNSEEQHAQKSISQLIHMLKNQYVENFDWSGNKKKTLLEALETVEGKIVGLVKGGETVSFAIPDPSLDNFLYLDDEKQHTVMIDQGWNTTALNYEHNDDPYLEVPLRALGFISEFMDKETHFPREIKTKIREYARDMIYRKKFMNHSNSWGESFANCVYNLGKLHLAIIRKDEKRIDQLVYDILNE